MTNSTPRSAQAAHAAATGGWPPRWRVPLLMLGFVGLAAGSGAGLARLGWAVPDWMASAAALHGPLMICGFFVVVRSLERAVALARGWAHGGALLAGAGSLSAVAGQAGPAAGCFLAGSAVLLSASVALWRRQPASFTAVLVVGAACWVVGNLAWLLGWPVHEIVPWWFGFLILTIAGERLELSRLQPRTAMAGRAFVVVLGLVLAGMLGSRTAWGAPVFGGGLLLLALWLLKHDIARRTVRSQGLTRFIAVCLLSGYAWLAIGASIILAAGGLQPGSAGYEAALHALGLGFVFSMVFGHAPIIFPAVVRVAVPYHPSFYVALLMLHASLALRLAGSAAGQFEFVRLGGALNVLALAAFIVGTASAVARRR